MNAAPNAGPTNVMQGGLLKTILGALLFIGIVIGLYYLYKFLYGTSAGQSDITLLDGSKSMTATTTQTGRSFVSGTDMQGILDGGQYTVNFWAYVADTKGFAKSPTPLAHLMEISNKRFDQTNKGKTLLFVGLNPINGTLIVRQNTDNDTKLDNASPLSSTAPMNFPVENLISGFNGSDSATFQAKDDRCDILNGIEYQRWVMVSVVANGRTLDVYLDGKLARSCVYKGNYSLGSADGTAQAFFGLNNEGNLKGFFASGRYYNYALTPDAIWSLYQAGPKGSFSIGNFFKNLFSIDATFGKTEQLNP